MLQKPVVCLPVEKLLQKPVTFVCGAEKPFKCSKKHVTSTTDKSHLNVTNDFKRRESHSYAKEPLHYQWRNRLMNKDTPDFCEMKTILRL